MDLTQLLVNCGSNDNPLRKSAEEQIKVFRRKDPIQFVCLLSQELADETKPEQARFLSSILFKNTILSTEPAFKGIWDSIPAEHKTTIKNFALGTLASPVKNARKGAAQIVSAIATLELPKQQWTEIVGTLAANAQGAVPEYKLASLETLGYICEELPERGLTEAQVDSILSALVSNIVADGPTEDVRMAALTALHLGVRFCEKNFRVEHERGIILDNILLNCSHTKGDIRCKAMMCLTEVVRCFYDFIIGSALEKIANTTYFNIQNDDSEQAAQFSIEVWCSICDEEIDRLKNVQPAKPCRDYIKLVFATLTPLLLECLKRKTEEDGTDWNISLSAACCLSLIAEIAKDSITEPIINFIGTNISSTEWKCREAALLSFIAILKGPSKAVINTLANQAIPTICKMLAEDRARIKETAAWTLVKLSEHSYEAIMENIGLVLPVLLGAIKGKPKVSAHICFVFNTLSDTLMAPPNASSGPLSGCFKDLLDSLWNNAFRPDAFEENINLANSSFAAFSNLIQNSTPDVQPIVYNYLQHMLEQFDAIVNGKCPIPARTEELEGYICSALQPSFIKLAGKLPIELADRAVHLMLESFQQRRSVYEEAVLAFGGIATAVGKDFDKYMEKFGPFLVYALKNTEDAGLSRISVGCVADITRALEERVAQYLAQFMPVLMEILKNTDTDRSVKLMAISVMSDIALYSNKFYVPYMKEVLEMFQSAAIASMQPASDEDPEMPQYMQNLRESIVEGYTGLTICAKEADAGTVFFPYVEGIFGFLAALCSAPFAASYRPDFQKSVAGLVNDLCRAFGRTVQQYVDNPCIQQMLKAANDTRDPKMTGYTGTANGSILPK